MRTRGDSGEHERMVELLVLWCRNDGWSDVKAPADEVRGITPDVQGNLNGKRAYGEVALAEDFEYNPAFPEAEIHLSRCVTELPTDYLLVLGVPRSVLVTASLVLEEWELQYRITLVPLEEAKYSKAREALIEAI